MRPRHRFSPEFKANVAEARPLSPRVEKLKPTKDKTAMVVNDTLTLAEVPAAALTYRLGNRSALEWVIDQYRVIDDPRTGLRSDPNRPDDPESIARLVGQETRASVKTKKLIAGLPPSISPLIRPIGAARPPRAVQTSRSGCSAAGTAALHQKSPIRATFAQPCSTSPIA